MSPEELIALASTDYKQAKELFSINVTGCSFSDIMLTLLLLPLLCIIYQEICKFVFKIPLYSMCPKWLLGLYHFCLEFLLFVIPVILVCTIWEERKWTYCVCGLIAGLLFLLNKCVSESEQSSKNSSIVLSISNIDSKYKGYITAFRSIVVLFTCVCILAVDFQVFPRKYAKTYLTGYSLMDIGTGLYLVSGGLVAPMRSLSLSRFFKEECILLLLGLGRWLFIRYFGYVINPLEYGPDWNFFFTLVVVHLVGFVIFQLMRNPLYILAMGAGITIYYQGLLSFGLADFIREIKSKSLMALNAPGVFSCFGYIGLYLMAAGIGMILNQTHMKRGRSMLIITAITAGLYGVTSWLVPASRRTSNSSYVFLVLFIAMILLTVAFFVNQWYGNIVNPLLLQSLNKHQLVVFLVANVFTGVINMVIKPIFATNLTAMIVLVVYMLVLSILACSLPNRVFFVC